MTSKQARETRQIEMVETHNIALSLWRIRNNCAGYDNERVKRSLYHALGMTGGLTNAEMAGIRAAMNLP